MTPTRPPKVLPSVPPIHIRNFALVDEPVTDHRPAGPSLGPFLPLLAPACLCLPGATACDAGRSVEVIMIVGDCGRRRISFPS